MLKIHEYIDKDGKHASIQHGTPFVVIGFCDGEWELSQTSWYDVKYNPSAVIDLFENLMVTLSVSDEDFQKYFPFSCEVEY